MQEEIQAVVQLLRVSNRKFSESEPENPNKITIKCMCKQTDGNGFSPWQVESQSKERTKYCKSANSNSLDGKSSSKSTTRSRDSRDSRRLAKKSSSNSMGDTSLRFYHFDDTCEYMTHYRENMTLPVLMQYRTKLLRASCGSFNCHNQNEMSVKLKDCNCSMNSPVPDPDKDWLSFDYVKQIETSLINRCYCDSQQVSVKAIIEQVKQRSTPYCDMTKNKNMMKKHQRPNGMAQQPQRPTTATKTTTSCNRKEYKTKDYNAYCNINTNKNSRSEKNRNEGKLKRKPKPTSSNKCLRQCQTQTVVLGKKGLSDANYKNILRLKGDCDSEIDALRVISATKMKIGPRMGSNYPPNDRKDTNRFTPNTTARRKIQQAVPQVISSFQECIGPVAISNSEVNHLNGN